MTYCNVFRYYLIQRSQLVGVYETYVFSCISVHFHFPYDHQTGVEKETITSSKMKTKNKSYDLNFTIRGDSSV